ncbi:MAG: hypothetical protein LBC80_08370 [Treponema sp.]|jgi:hypothetical protein|nr:hypothetical protein [Treponema sp.]
MVAVKGRYDGMAVVLDRIPSINQCDVIVTFLETPVNKSIDDGSLEFLFKDYIDDEIREPIINFGRAVGNEQW